MAAITNDGGFPVGEHDFRCATWGNNDPDSCTCDDDMGHAPPVRLTDSPTLRAGMHTAFDCDDDPDERTL